MRIITANLNGIRAAARKGFFNWFAQQEADVICIQETKAQLFQLSDAQFHPAGYHCYYHDAVKKGYSGVAIYTRIAPKQVQYGIGWDYIDNEGRYLSIELAQARIISLYMHSGSASDGRQQLKYRFMDQFLPHLKTLQKDKKPTIVCGDWNIAHTQADIKNWRSNQKNSGFLPEERAWMDTLLNQSGYIDAFRQLEQQEHQYTWWSNRGKAWENNTGWRIDYQIASDHLTGKVLASSIYKQERFSDHAPLIIDYDL